MVQGNPINEVKLLQLVHSFDLVNSAVPEELKFAMANFAKAIILAEDNFYLGKETPKTKRIENFANDSRVWNNWQTWRIALRASAAGFLHDSAELKKTKIVIDEMFEKNLPQNSPGFDFEHRDALLYHVYNLQAWINIAWYTPYLLSASQLSRIEQAVSFIRPFYLGEQSHIEFSKSRVPWDKTRAESGANEYKNIAWIPDHADTLLRIARCLFPSVLEWTARLDRAQNDFSPRIKFIAALGCEAE